MSDDMVKYYRDRAREYEQIYEWGDPDRQQEQDRLGEELKQAFRSCNVLDIGCGTGYWTERVSETAERITGIDINEAVLKIARSKTYGCPTEFRAMDGYSMEFPPDTFTGALASFWLSHVHREDMDGWIEHMHGVLAPGARVFITDNTYLDGVGGLPLPCRHWALGPTTRAAAGAIGIDCSIPIEPTFESLAEELCKS